MSFKREGDDSSWLNILAKRRVAELFAADIPEDEAFLMKNGRFACLVCSHRPVFDTVVALAVHRNGKKHASNHERFQLEKTELDDLKLKRLHEEYVKNGGKRSREAWDVSNKPTSSGEHRLLNACIYNPCVKRHKSDPYGRRTTINVTSADSHDTSSSYSPATSTSCDSSLQLSSSTDNRPPQTIAEIRLHRKRLLTADKAASVKPYVAKRPPLTSPSSAAVRSESSSHNTAHTGVTARLEGPPVTSPAAYSNAAAAAEDDSRKRSFDDARHRKSTATKVETVAVRSDRVNRYLSAVESGWKRTRDGTWIKDDQAEFDSDDEPPDVL